MGGLGVVAALGSAAIVRLLSARIDALGSPMTPFASLTRASVLYVAAGYLPVIGWGIVLPAALLLSVGSGVAVLFRGEAAGAARSAPARPRPGRFGDSGMNTTRRRILGLGAVSLAAELAVGLREFGTAVH